MSWSGLIPAGSRADKSTHLLDWRVGSTVSYNIDKFIVRPILNDRILLNKRYMILSAGRLVALATSTSSEDGRVSAREAATEPFRRYENILIISPREVLELLVLIRSRLVGQGDSTLAHSACQEHYAMGAWYRVIKTVKGHRYVYKQRDVPSCQDRISEQAESIGARRAGFLLLLRASCRSNAKRLPPGRRSRRAGRSAFRGGLGAGLRLHHGHVPAAGAARHCRPARHGCAGCRLLHRHAGHSLLLLPGGGRSRAHSAAAALGLNRPGCSGQACQEH